MVAASLLVFIVFCVGNRNHLWEDGLLFGKQKTFLESNYCNMHTHHKPLNTTGLS